MEDSGIVDLYWQRSQQAIVETDDKYGNYCFSIAWNILTNREDAQQSVSDTYLADRIHYGAFENPENPWFRRTGQEWEMEPVSREEYQAVLDAHVPRPVTLTPVP